MSDLRKAAEQVLNTWDTEDWFDADALRAALAQPEQDLRLVANLLKEYGLEALEVIVALKTQPEQEPVAWINEHGHIDRGLDAVLDPAGWTPLYTAPPQRKPLTDQEAQSLWADVYEPGHHLWIIAERFARAIEAAHGIGVKE